MTLHRFATFSIHLTQQAEHALSQWIEPCLGCDLISAGAIRDLFPLFPAGTCRSEPLQRPPDQRGPRVPYVPCGYARGSS